MVGAPAPGRLALLAAVALSACAPRATVRPSGDGLVVFAWEGEGEAAWVCGTMTGWNRVPLVRSGGRFEVSLQVPPGRHEYRLEVLDKTGFRIVLPPGVEQADDGFGGENAVLRVGAR
jgi:hypothetical protein